MSSEHADIALREIYETVFGIHNHQNPNPMRPLALVAMNPVEDTATFSPLYRRIEEYMDLKLFESTGMPLDQFLMLPSEYIRLIVRKAKANLHTKGKAIDKQLAKLDQEIGKG